MNGDVLGSKDTEVAIMFVVAGVTGNTGKIVADTLLAKGAKVRVLVRDAAKGDPWKARGAEVAVAELNDVAALTKALAGAKGAYLLLPPKYGVDDLVGAQKQTTDAIVTAVAASNVEHVVLLSSVGAQHEEGTGPIKTLHYAEKQLTEKTKAKLTFVRAAYFLENWAPVAAATKGGKLPTFIRRDQVIPMVATKDIGTTAAKVLLEGPPSARVDVIELAGPRDWSAADIAGIFGKDVVADEAPLDAVVPTFMSFGASKDAAEQFRELYAGILDGKVAFEKSGARLVRGSVDAASLLPAFAK
jgi:uncharacterized protein YbjT (DUF2867 family)